MLTPIHSFFHSSFPKLRHHISHLMHNQQLHEKFCSLLNYKNDFYLNAVLQLLPGYIASNQLAPFYIKTILLLFFQRSKHHSHYLRQHNQFPQHHLTLNKILQYAKNPQQINPLVLDCQQIYIFHRFLSERAWNDTPFENHHYTLSFPQFCHVHR